MPRRSWFSHSNQLFQLGLLLYVWGWCLSRRDWYFLVIFICMIGEIWKFHARTNEGEHSVEQESSIWIIYARAIQLQSLGRHITQCLSWKQDGYTSKKGGTSYSCLNVYFSCDIDPLLVSSLCYAVLSNVIAEDSKKIWHLLMGSDKFEAWIAGEGRDYIWKTAVTLYVRLYTLLCS